MFASVALRLKKRNSGELLGQVSSRVMCDNKWLQILDQPKERGRGPSRPRRDEASTTPS